MPVVGEHDLFEQTYTAAFKARLSRYGLFLNYENDRAALDLGLHLYDPAAAVGQRSQESGDHLPTRPIHDRVEMSGK